MEIKQSRHSHVHQHTPDRLENPDRVRELNPAATLHQVEGDVLPVPDRSADLALVATVLHEIPEKAPFIREIHRLLKPDGRLAVIEFHARITPFGPPPSERLSQVDVITQLETHGLMLQDKFDLGANFYCAILGKS